MASSFPTPNRVTSRTQPCCVRKRLQKNRFASAPCSPYPEPVEALSMKIPTIQGIISRRVLLNYRVDPEVAANILPSPFRPKLHRGHAIAGICLIRLEKIRPKGLPAALGISSENSAHRIAVEWESENGEHSEGVFVPRRDTNARLNALAGGRVFPGVHSLSRFEVQDDEQGISIRVSHPKECALLLEFSAEEADSLPTGSIFESFEESSQFFEGGCLGYSTRPDSCELDGLELRIDEWKASPLSIRHVRSSFYDDRSLFPEGSIAFDHALLMRNIPHEWHSLPRM